MKIIKNENIFSTYQESPSNLKKNDCIPKTSGGCSLKTGNIVLVKYGDQKEPNPSERFLEIVAYHMPSTNIPLFTRFGIKRSMINETKNILKIIFDSIGDFFFQV